AEKCSRYRVRRTASIGWVPCLRPCSITFVGAATYVAAPDLATDVLFTLVCETRLRAVSFVATCAVPEEWRFVFPVVTVAAFEPAPAPSTRPKRITPYTFINPDTGDSLY